MFHGRSKLSAAAVSTGLVALIVSSATAIPHSADGERPPTSRESENGFNWAGSRAADWDRAQSAEDAIAATMRGLDGRLFNHVRVGPSPSDDGRIGTWFFADMTIGEKPSTADYLLRGWESDLAKGAVADRMTANQKNLASVIVGSTTTGTDGSGRTSELFNGMSDVVTGQQFAAQATKRSDEEIERSIREFAASNGVTVSRLDILHPLGPALRITFANVPTQAAILTSFSDSLRREFLSERPDYEGFFVQLEDVDGSLIMINTTAYRGGSGRLWVDPQYDSALGIPHSGQAPSLRALQDEGEKP